MEEKPESQITPEEIIEEVVQAESPAPASTPQIEEVIEPQVDAAFTEVMGEPAPEAEPSMPVQAPTPPSMPVPAVEATATPEAPVPEEVATAQAVPEPAVFDPDLPAPDAAQAEAPTPAPEPTTVADPEVPDLSTFEPDVAPAPQAVAPEPELVRDPEPVVMDLTGSGIGGPEQAASEPSEGLDNLISPPVASETSRFAKLPAFVPLALAGLGVILGITALIIALSASGGGGPSSQTMALKEQVMSLESKMGHAQEDIAKGEDNYAKAYDQMRTIATQVQEALSEASSEMQDMRRSMKLYEKTMKSIAKATNQSVVYDEPAQPKLDAKEQLAPTKEVPGFRLYRIEPGDTLSKIAREHKVKLNDLIEDNPQANPKKLQIGQHIKIPN